MTNNTEGTGVFSKTEFILAFAALLIGFTGFSSQMQSVSVYLGFRNSNLWELCLFSFSLLCLSIYLYALDSIRYGITFLEDWKVFKYLRELAHFIYSLAIVSPLAIFFLWLIVSILNNLPVIEIRNNIDNISLLSTILGVFVSFLISFIQITTKQKIVQEEINERASELLVETDKLTKDKNWRSVVVETFRLLELMFRSKAENYGIDVGRIPFSRLVRIFVNKGVITKEQAAKLDHLREIRNLAVHSDQEISKQQAIYATDIVDEVGKNLTSAKFISGYFENSVLSALSKLFLKHHTFPQFEIGKGRRVDFMTEGPNHTYYIEVKMTETPILIRQAIRQLQSMLDDNDRGLLVLPLSAKKVDIDEPRIRILFFDIKNGKFSNEREIYKWIYE